MSDDERDIRALLESEAERAPRPQGLHSATIRSGRGRRIGVVALPLLVATSVAWVAVAQPFASDRNPKVVGPGPGADVVEATPVADFMVSADDRAVDFDSPALTMQPRREGFDTSILAFDRPSTPIGCTDSAFLRLYINKWEGEQSLSLYPSSIFSAAQLSEGSVIRDYGRVLDTRPKVDLPIQASEGWLELDVTEIYNLWMKGGPFPSRGETTPDSSPIVFVVRPTTYERNGDFTKSVASSESEHPPVLALETNPCAERETVATFGRYTFSIGGGFDGQRGPLENVGVVEVNSADGSVCVQSHILGSSSAHLHRVDETHTTIPILEPPTVYRSTLCARDLDRTVLQEVIEDPSSYFIEFHKEGSDGTLTAPLELMGEPEDERSEAPYCVGDEICLSRSSGPAGVDVTASVPATGTAENGVDEIRTDKVEWWWGLEGEEWIDVVEGNPPEGASLLAVAQNPRGASEGSLPGTTRDGQLITSFIVPFGGHDPGTYPIFAISYSDGGHGASGTEIDFELTDGYGCPTLLPPGPNAESDANPVITAYLGSRHPDGSSGFNYHMERLERAMPEGPGGNCPEETWLRSYQVEGNFVWKQGERQSAGLAYFRFNVGRAEGDWVVWTVAH